MPIILTWHVFGFTFTFNHKEEKQQPPLGQVTVV